MAHSRTRAASDKLLLLAEELDVVARDWAKRGKLVPGDKALARLGDRLGSLANVLAKLAREALALERDRDKLRDELYEHGAASE